MFRPRVSWKGSTKGSLQCAWFLCSLMVCAPWKYFCCFIVKQRAVNMAVHIFLSPPRKESFQPQQSDFAAGNGRIALSYDFCGKFILRQLKRRLGNSPPFCLPPKPLDLTPSSNVSWPVVCMFLSSHPVSSLSSFTVTQDQLRGTAPCSLFCWIFDSFQTLRGIEDWGSR